MANDLRVNLRMNSEDFDRNIAKSKKQLQDWKSKTDVASASMQSSFSNITEKAGKMFVAFMAIDKIKNFGQDIINSSQKTGDAFQNNVNAMTSSYEAFCSALATSDFSAFEGGLIGVYNRALELSALLDSIADAQMAVNYSSSVYAVELKKNENIAKDRSLDKKERRAAYERNISIIEKENADRMKVADEGRNAAMKNAQLQGINIEILNKDDVDYYLRELNNDFNNSSFIEQLKYAESYIERSGKEWSKIIDKEQRNPGLYLGKERDEYKKSFPGIKDSLIGKFGDDTMFGGDHRKLLAFGGLYNQGDKGRKMLYDYFENYKKEELRYQSSLGSLVTLKNRIGEIDAEGSATKTTKTTGVTSKGKISVRVDIEDSEDVYDDTNLNASWDGMLSNREEKRKNSASQALLNSDSFKAMSEAYVPEDLPDVQSIDISDQIGQFQSLGYAISGVASSLDDGAAKWVSYGSNIISAVSSALPSLSTLLAANTAVAGSGAAASAASIPFVGWAMAGVALAGVVASIATLPKFATGTAYIPPTISGDQIPALMNAGEMVLNERQQTKLFNQLNSRERFNGASQGGSVEFKIKGDYLVGILNKTNSRNNRI